MADMKARGGLQKELAAALGESDATLSGRISGARGIPDDFIDLVQEKTGVPFTVGGGVEGVTADMLREFVQQARTNNNLLNGLVEDVRAIKSKVL